MLVAEARVETERSSRYLVQLCQHVRKVGHTSPQMQTTVEWSDDQGLISFGWGRCTLRAEPGVLTLRAEASDEEGLHRLQQRIADRLEAFGRHDRLTVTWRPPSGASEPMPSHQPGPISGEQHMADPPPYPEVDGDGGGTRDPRPSTDNQSRMATVVLILVGLLVALIIVLHAVGGGFRGPH